jgi:hypothetical protein
LHTDTVVFKGNIMKVTVKGYLHQCQYSWMSEPEFVLLSTLYKNNTDYIPVRQEPYEFEAEVPDSFDPRPQQIAALEEQKRKLQAEFAQSVAKIDDQIKKYLAIAA